MRVVRFSILAGAVLAFAAACGGSEPPATAGTAAVACGGTAGTPVAVADFSFTPAELSLAAGAVATWTNTGAAPHTVTFDNGPDCGRIDAGATVSATFTSAGTFAYHCTIHPAMTGTVVVQ